MLGLTPILPPAWDTDPALVLAVAAVMKRCSATYGYDLPRITARPANAKEPYLTLVVRFSARLSLIY